MGKLLEINNCESGIFMHFNALESHVNRQPQSLFPILLRKMSRRPRFGVTASSVAGQTMQLVGSEDAVTVRDL